MNQDTLKEIEKPVLLAEVQQILAGSVRAFKQERSYRRALALFMAEVLTLGRHTVTQLLRSLGLVDEDWSAWYQLFSRPRIDETELGAQLLAETLVEVPASAAYVTTIDGVIIPRAGL